MFFDSLEFSFIFIALWACLFSPLPLNLPFGPLFVADCISNDVFLKRGLSSPASGLRPFKYGFIGSSRACPFGSPNNRKNAPLSLRDESEDVGAEDRREKIRYPVNNDAPLRDVPVPPWVVEFVTKKEPEEPYVPRHFSQEEIEAGIGQYNAEARSRSKTQIEESPCLKLKSYGFKFKQIQPIRHHNGRAFTFFYVHSLHTDVVPVLLNSLRRVAKRHLGAGRITALRIPGMENEFYSIVGLREDFFELSKNLRGVIFRNVPESATFHNPIIATLRVKGPIIAVAGHLKIKGPLQALNVKKTKGKWAGGKDSAQVESADDDKSDGSGSLEGGEAAEKGAPQEELLMNRPYTDQIEIVNKNHYLCSLSQGNYLTMDVKIEYIANYVVTEHGPESLNRDITEDRFIHFNSLCDPVEVFGFVGERRGIDESSTSEIVTLEVHTDGSTTPRMGLLRSASFLLAWFERTLHALRERLGPDYYARRRMNVVNTDQMMTHHEMNRNLPWNPYLSPSDRVANRLKWFYRRDVRRQYPIDPESSLARAEQRKEWETTLEDQILYQQQIRPILSDDEGADVLRRSAEDIVDKRIRAERKKDNNPPLWVFRDPVGPGNIGQQAVLGFDDEPPPVSPDHNFH